MIGPSAAAVVRAGWAERVVSPAYDAITPEERAAAVAADPYSFLAVTVSPLDETSGEEVDAALAAGEAALARLLAADAYEAPGPPAYHLYELRAGDHRQVAVVGELDVASANDGWLRRHERTRPSRVDVLARHVARLGVMSSPIAAAVRRGSGLAELVDRLVATREPKLDFTVADGLAQRVWRIDDAGGEAAVRDLLAREPVYIVDGHHRADAWSSERAVAATGGAGMLVAAFPAEQLRVLPYHRLVARRLSPTEIERFERELRARFAVRATEGGTPPAPHLGELAVRVGAKWWQVALGPLDDVPAGTGAGSADGGVVGRLDAVRLQVEILGPLLGIGNPGRDPDLRVVAGTTPVPELARRADALGGVAFALAATSVDDVVAVADAGAAMPPKSTYFDPKVRSGVFLRRVGPARRSRRSGG